MKKEKQREKLSKPWHIVCLFFCRFFHCCQNRLSSLDTCTPCIHSQGLSSTFESRAVLMRHPEAKHIRLAFVPYLLAKKKLYNTRISTPKRRKCPSTTIAPVFRTMFANKRRFNMQIVESMDGDEPDDGKFHNIMSLVIKSFGKYSVSSRLLNCCTQFLRALCRRTKERAR